MRISDWSSDVCSSDLPVEPAGLVELRGARSRPLGQCSLVGAILPEQHLCLGRSRPQAPAVAAAIGDLVEVVAPGHRLPLHAVWEGKRSEEHTSELQSLMRISYAVFCLTKKKQHKQNDNR